MIRAKGGEGTNASDSRRKHAALVTGLAGGAFSGLTGVGGGAVMVPLLTGRLGLSQHRAHATSLAIILFVAIAGVAGYWRAGNIDWRLVAAFTPTAMLGVFAGARAMMKVPALQLRLLFGVFLFFVAFRQLVWNVEAGASYAGAMGLMLDALFGFAGGVLAGVLGVGGGAIFVPAIVVLGLADVPVGEDPQKVAQGVSLVVIVATAAVGTLTNWRQGVVDAPAVAWTAPAACAAALAASLTANALDSTTLRVIYGLTALILAAQTVYTAIGGMRAGRRTETEAV
ncbi:MAG TPA: sulfite exporter TauE/SafE family protein [Dehalococcoidia bacterium]|nr:sulfite exporter TauE/SafE family protein [Dehalococcoidia bacterium]